MRQAALNGFRVALMYDEGTISWTGMPTTTYTTLARNDLLYATKYFTMPVYLTMTRGITTGPAIFVFPYDNVDPHIDWAYVRNQLTTSLGIPVILLDKDPTPANAVKFDGFYAWVQPANTGWRSDGTEWGELYLKWFYNEMSTTYSNTIAVGGVWPGFDDSLASWGSNRYMWRRCGKTWYDTWKLANDYNPPFVMIDTWNDFEEGTDIELGIGECLLPSQPQTTLPVTQVVYTHLVVNTSITDSITDTLTLTASSSHAWPVTVNPASLTLPHNGSASVIVTLTIPLPITSGIQDKLTITATSAISPALFVHCSVVDTTTILTPLHKIFLPFISNQELPEYPVAPLSLCFP